MAEGFEGVIDKPTHLLVGEAGAEQVSHSSVGGWQKRRRNVAGRDVRMDVRVYPTIYIYNPVGQLRYRGNCEAGDFEGA